MINLIQKINKIKPLKNPEISLKNGVLGSEDREFCQNYRGERSLLHPLLTTSSFNHLEF